MTFVYQLNLVENLLESIGTFSYDKNSIPQQKLDLDEKTRTSLFPWRGQFSPELIEVLIEQYGKQDSVVLDPFAGSGTTLFESARKGLTCYGAEINPAAVEMAKTVHFVNLPLTERQRVIQAAETIANKYFTPYEWKLFTYNKLEKQSQIQIDAPTKELINELLKQAADDQLIYSIIVNTLLRYFNHKRPKNPRKFLLHLQEHCNLIENLTYSKKQCRIFYSDAQNIPLPDKCVDLIITSPPYINVFNYHQNNRPVIELLGWDLLKVAKSEMGSNRKNRQNRFLTVIQYALDIQDALKEMHRLLNPSGRIIIVLGRESSVRGVSFKNGKLVAAIAVGAAGFFLEKVQERKFKNKFGEIIYEDIIHLLPLPVTEMSGSDIARLIAIRTLSDALKNLENQQVKREIFNAKERGNEVVKSPLFELPTQHSSLEDEFISRVNYTQAPKPFMTTYPTPHLEKLNALLKKPKLPASENPRVFQAIKVYRNWIALMDATVASNDPPEKILKKLVGLFNGYKLFIDVFLIFDSPDDFLYRQKGQLKLDNTIIEEFLPRLIHPNLIPEVQKMDIESGPIKAFSSIYFESSLDNPVIGGGLRIRTKDQDFAISKKIYIKTSHSANFDVGKVLNTSANLAYIAAECKTNLDKTMFQEGCATARDVKSAVAGAKYFLLCEWLDMTPLSTAPTDIDEIIIMRKAKRINSNVRAQFNTFAGRQARRSDYYQYLREHPFQVDMFERFVNHIRKLLNHEELIEEDVLSLGYF